MAMICDACETRFGRTGGQSTLNVSPPTPDFKLFHALATVGQTYDPPERLELDLCLACTAKVLGFLGLSTAICELPQMPPEPSDPLHTGALTPEDLRQLGLASPADGQA